MNNYSRSAVRQQPVMEIITIYFNILINYLLDYNFPKKYRDMITININEKIAGWGHHTLFRSMATLYFRLEKYRIKLRAVEIDRSLADRGRTE